MKVEIDLETADEATLWENHRRIQEKLASKEKDRQEALSLFIEALKLAAENAKQQLGYAFTLEDAFKKLFPSSTSSATNKGKKIEPKYREPTTNQQWTGQGSPPRWLRAEAGQDRDWSNADAQKWASDKGYAINGCSHDGR